MGAPYSVDLRERVVAAFRGGLSRAEVAKRFQVGEASVQRWAGLAKNAGSVAPKPMGGRTPFALSQHRDWILSRIAEQPDLPLRELLSEVQRRDGNARYYALWNIVRRAKLSFKKKPACQRARSPEDRA